MYLVDLPPRQHAGKEQAVGGSQTSASLYVASQTMRTAVGPVLTAGGVFVWAAPHSLPLGQEATRLVVVAGERRVLRAIVASFVVG